MARSYLVNLLVEIIIEDQDIWEDMEDSLDDRYNWEADFYDYSDSSPYVVSASVEGWTEI